MAEDTDILGNLKRIEAQKQPGNWVDRIVNSMRSKKKRAMVHPCVIDGHRTLVYERGLAETDPHSFQLLVEYADLYGYLLKEDQRADFLEGVKRVRNKSCANVISIMVLTAGLMSQTAYAKTDDDHHDHAAHIDPDITQNRIEAGYDFNIDSFKTQDELAAGLLTWINQHSSFDYNIDKVPKIKKVSAHQIAKVAFGGELPKAINPESLQIFGLYNFNEEAVYLLDSIDLETNEGKAILLHELVHFLQYQTGIDKDAKCKNELESLAYVLEAKFLDAHDHDHNISMKHIQKVSQCKV